MSPRLELYISASVAKAWSKRFFTVLTEKTLTHLDICGRVALAINLVSAETIQQINRDYRQIDAPTDVIAFAFADTETIPTDDETRHLGEIYLCESVIKAQAKRYAHSTKAEMGYIFVHGLLHLLGYDHQTAEEKQAMTALNQLLTKSDNA